MNPVKEYASCSVPQEPQEDEGTGDLVELRRVARTKKKAGAKELDSETQIHKLRENQRMYQRNQKTLSQQVQEKDQEVREDPSFLYFLSRAHKNSVEKEK